MDLVLLGNKSNCVGLSLESKATKVKSESIIHYRVKLLFSYISSTRPTLNCASR